ncbi:MAG: DUF6082 family protein [Actinoallomurus sp.]
MRATGWSAVILAGIVAVFLAPFAMRKIHDLPGLNWAELANVGQTYEAVAAVLAVPTFAGVVVSLLSQRREVHTGQVQTALHTQIELARIAIDHPEALEIDGTVSSGHSVAQARQYVLVNLWVSQWRSLYALGHLTDQELRLVLARMFTRAQARAWWSDARASYRTGVRDRRERRFFEIAENEYSRAACSSPVGGVPSGTPGSVRSRAGIGRAKAGAACLAAAAVGGISGWLITRSRLGPRDFGDLWSH